MSRSAAQSHFGNHIWYNLWYYGTPISVFRSYLCSLSNSDIQEAINRINGDFGYKLLELKLTFNLEDEGIFLFGPDSVREPWPNLPHYRVSGFYLQTDYKICPASEAIGVKRLANIALRWPLWNIPVKENVYGLGGLVHELMHAVGIADHYYSYDCDGYEGIWPGSTITSNPGLGYLTDADVGWLDEFYTQAPGRALFQAAPPVVFPPPPIPPPPSTPPVIFPGLGLGTFMKWGIVGLLGVVTLRRLRGR